MTPAILTELKRLEREATEAPWFVIPDKSGMRPDGSEWQMDREVCYGDPSRPDETYSLADHYHEPDDQLIVAMRNSLSALIEAVETMHAALEKLRDGPGNKMANWPATWCSQYSSEALARVAALLGEGREK